jgi:3-hydroxybutyryl-CoA dehydrogenase
VNVKGKIFRELSQVTKPEAILATNTSSIPITTLAMSTDRPDKVIGMHFMNPVPVMKLVEIINGNNTSQDTYKKTVELAKAMGKETSYCLKDSPGFIANRILMPYINEAILALEEGIATPEDIDKTMVLGTNVPMGPLTLADFIGLDTCLAILRVLYEGFKNEKYRPAKLLETMVSQGKIGKKSGEGFYKYK